ncbi:MAG: BrnA antitoxin family protein [Rickettsiales bacterium]|jgi:uncharacterized protein (DUF4415 family)|nr:BrnA antitoxin family protein [Rickettsiales bacterium]
MTIKRMTLEQIERSITPAMKRRARAAMLREPDLTDPDAPEVTDAMFAVARRPGRVSPEMKKVSQNIRFDRDVLDGLKKTGRNWSTRVNAVMRGYLSGLGVL